MPKTALITGCTGQDGSYLAELLLSKGYTVHGMIRRSSSFNTGRIDHLLKDKHDEEATLFLHYGDMLDGASLRRILTITKPDEVYNLAAQSHVRTSFDQPVYTTEVIALGTLNLLEALRDYRDATGVEVRMYQASSSEMYGNNLSVPYEAIGYNPVSPYGCAKVLAHSMALNYKHAYGMHICRGILFNHESPRRGETFVTRKITRAATRIKLGLQDKLYLGNLDAERDWGYAPEYVEAMWLMLQQDKPDSYDIGTGESHSIRTFLHMAFELLELDYGEYVVIDDRYKRPNELHRLEADTYVAAKVLPWKAKVMMPELCRIMVDADMRLAEAEHRARACISTPDDATLPESGGWRVK